MRNNRVSEVENYKQGIQSMVQEGVLPRFVYKFRSFDEYFDDIIKCNQLWFSSPLDFNDPFDCNCCFYSNEYSQDSKFWDNPIFIEELKNMSEIPINDEIIEITKKIATANFNQNPGKFDSFIRAAHDHFLNESSMCCFSKNWSNILQWSHYADSHKGIALKFDILKDKSFFNFPFNVIYTKEFPVVDYYNDEKVENYKKSTLTKAIDWSYEEEVRIVKEEKSGNQFFSKSSLIEIIFGVNCEESQIDRIMKLAIDFGYSHVKFYKTVKMPARYGLIKTEL